MKGQFYILAAIIVLMGIYLTSRYLNEQLVIQPSTPSDELSFAQDVKSSFDSLVAEPQRTFAQDFRTIQGLIRERSAGSFSVLYNCSGSCPGDRVEMRTKSLTGELDFLLNMSRQSQPVPWWDDNTTDSKTYDRRIKLILSENAGVDRSEWPLVLSGADLSSRGVSLSSIKLDSMRLVDPTASPDELHEVSGNDIPFQVDQKDGTGDYVLSPNGVLDPTDELVFVVNLTSLQVKDLYLYYSDSGTWLSKAYSSDLSWSSSGHWVENSEYVTNYSSSWGSIDRLAVDKNRDGVINETSLTSSMAPKITGSYLAYDGTGIRSSGPVRVILDSAVYAVNSSSFSGNVSRRVEHWAGAPRFKLSHKVDSSDDQASEKLQFEFLGLNGGDWYRVLYPLAGGIPGGGFNTTVVSEQMIPGYFFTQSASSGTSGFIFTDSPAEHGASSVVQWALEREAGQELSRKAWLKAQGSNSSRWEAWVFASPDPSSTEPITVWQGLQQPVFTKFWKEESR